jgi:hypothetical protein
MQVMPPRAAARLLVLAVLTAPALLSAQSEPTTSQLVQVDPIRCWWRTSSDGVRIGETFTVTLTCAVIDTEAVQVVADESQLNPLAFQLTPFEVVSGSHPGDLRSGQRRFFQYDYVSRIISRDAIGRDVPFPPVVIHYRVNSRVGGNQSQQGRDLTYIMPEHSMRVVSVVPNNASDIRDSSDESFGRIEALAARASVLEIVAITLIALGSVMTIVLLASLVRARRKATATGDPAFGEWTILGLAARELAAVRREAEGGWTEALAARALAALRVVAQAALGRPVSQRIATSDSRLGEGRLILRRLRPRGQITIVSSPTTTEAIARGMKTAPPARQQQLEALSAAIAAFTVAQYGRAKEMKGAELNEGLEAGLDVAKSVRAEWMWPRPQLRRWKSRMPVLERQA